MAIILEENYKGIKANYWRINKFQLDSINNIATITLGLYPSKEARLDSINNYLKLEDVIIHIPEEFYIEVKGSNLPVINTIKNLLYIEIMKPIKRFGKNVNKFANGIEGWASSQKNW